MHEIAVHAEFAAAHALRIAGQVAPLHGHNWRITARIQGDQLDRDGLVCDFHTVHDVLMQIIAPFHNNNLNDVPPFSKGVNPTAELVAQHIARELHLGLDAALAPHARLASVSVSEAPGCVATYSADPPAEGQPNELDEPLPVMAPSPDGGPSHG